MIDIDYFDKDQREHEPWVGQIVLRPNNSLTWRAAQYFLAAMCLVSFTIALSFTWQGYWVILLFTTIEMTALAAGFWICLQRNNRQEVLRFSADQLVLESGRRRPDRRLIWPRFFTKIHVQSNPHPWYPQRIALRHRQEEHEIGRFLSVDEKKRLVTGLRRMIAHADRVQVNHHGSAQP